MTKSTLLLVFILLSCFANAQTVFWSDSFEDVGAPSSGSRTPSYEGGSGGPPNTRYFKRTTSADISAGAGYSSIQGSKFWAAEDVDAAPNGVANTQSSEQNVTWTSINISGKLGLSFRGLFATTVTTSWDHGTSTLIADYCIVQARIDGGAWMTIINFRPNSLNNTNGALALDNNSDGLGDGTTLNAAFTEFSANIPGTGTTLELRCASSSSSLVEELAFDNFRLLSTGVLPVTLVDFSGSSVNGGNKLTWATASEQNSKYFQIERSTDAGNFDKIGSVDAAGTSASVHQYTFLDQYNNAPKLYYRLKQVDADGRFTYSKTISVQAVEQDKAMQVFPNPVADKLVVDPGDISITSPAIQLINSSGIRMPVVFIKKGNNYECITTGLQPGVYFVKIISENRLYSRPVIKK